MYIYNIKRICFIPVVKLDPNFLHILALLIKSAKVSVCILFCFGKTQNPKRLGSIVVQICGERLAHDDGEIAFGHERGG